MYGTQSYVPFRNRIYRYRQAYCGSSLVHGHTWRDPDKYHASVVFWGIKMKLTPTTRFDWQKKHNHLKQVVMLFII